MLTRKLSNISQKMRLIFTVLLTCSFLGAMGQQIYPTMGTEFWLGYMENYNTSANDRLEIFITSDVNTSGTVSIPQQGFSQNFNVVANVTTTVLVPNANAEHYGGGFVDNRGILIETNDTCAVFAINFDNYTADATKVLPTVSLGTEYLVSTYLGLSGNSYNSEFVIVATEDGTEVEITPSSNTSSGQTAGVPFIVQLDRGESYQIQAAVGSDDLTGSTIIATPASGDCRPFAVFSGTMCTNTPVGCYACDHTFDQNFPTETWGTDYFIVPISFATNYTYRVMALNNGTNYTIDGGAPQLLNAGQFDEYNYDPSAHCIQADGPICVTQHLEGVGCAGSGDPAQMILNASDQMISDITFSTVTSTVITQHGLNVIMETPYTNTLSLDGVPVNAGQFTPFTNCGGYSWAQITIAQGSHTLTSPFGFTAYVYGTGSAESYAYSVGSFSTEPIPPIDTVICTSDTATLVAPNGLFNPWWATQTNPTDTIGTGTVLVLPPPVTTDIYIVTGDALVSGCEQTYSYSVEYQQPPAMTITIPDDTVCLYESIPMNVTLNPPGSYLYDWTPPLEFNNPNIVNPILTPSQSGWYVCNIQSLTGCVSFADSIYVTVVGGDVLTVDAITGNGTDQDTLCPGDDSQLDVEMQRIIFNDNFDPLNNGLWASLQNGVASSLCGSVNGNALYFDGAGVRSAETNGMDVSTGGTVRFMLKIANGAAPCENADPGENVVLEYSAMGGPWTIINTYFESMYPNFTMINEAIPAGAMSTNTQFRWRQLANSGAGQDNWALDNCVIATLNNSGFLYQWTPAVGLTNAAIPNPVADPAIATVYEVMVIDTVAGCNYVDSVTILVDVPFTLDMPNDTILCDVAGVQLDANPTAASGHTFAWTPNNGTLTSTTIQNPVATPNVTTTYYVDATSDLGCTVTDSINITVAGLNSVTATTNNNDFCQGQSAILNAVVSGNPNAYTFNWMPNLDLDDNTLQSPTATPTDTVMYIVTVTDTASGCILIDSIQINVIPSFPVTAMNDTALCHSVNLPLTVTHGAVGAVTYDWQPAGLLNDNTLASPTITSDADTTFYVTVTDGQGCSNIDSVHVTILYTDVFLGNDTSLCQGETLTLDAGNYVSYQWSTSPNDTLQTITINASGTYSVDVVNAEGCFAQDTITVVVFQLPVVNLGPDTALCDGLSVDLDAANAGSTYDWSTNETTQIITVTTTNNYSVTVTDGNGCQNSDDINVTFNPLPVIDLGVDQTVCENQVVVLDAGNAGAIFNWSTTENTQSIIANNTDTYWVEVTNQFNCTSTDTVDVTIITHPIVDLGPDTALCHGESLMLIAGNPTFYSNWSTSEFGDTIVVTTSDLYSVSVTNGYCTTTDQIDVIFNPLPQPLPYNDTTFCDWDIPGMAVLDAGNQGATYLWSTGETTQQITVNNDETFYVTITTPENCAGTDSVEVNIFCQPTIYVPNSFTPNGDGRNDYFQAYGENIVEFEMFIFDRWGQLIFHSEEMNLAWGGTYDGTPVQQDVYVWKIKYRYQQSFEGPMSSKKELTGHVTLLR